MLLPLDTKSVRIVTKVFVLWQNSFKLQMALCFYSASIKYIFLIYYYDDASHSE